MRLADAAFAASGAYHIELGAGQGQGTMLSHEYYPMNAKVMDSALQGAMERHYDFITAYENLLYAPEIAYADTGTQYLTIANEAVSGAGEAGKIWYIARQSEDYSILHLINLTGEDDTQWRNATAAPTTKENLAVRYYLGENAAVSGVYLASPDRDGCQSTSLSYTTGVDEKGSYVAFTVPSLEYWDMIYIRRSNGSDTVFEAENALKTRRGRGYGPCRLYRHRLCGPVCRAGGQRGLHRVRSGEWGLYPAPALCQRLRIRGGPIRDRGRDLRKQSLFRGPKRLGHLVDGRGGHRSPGGGPYRGPILWGL